MQPIPHPETLGPEFLPPTLLGREAELERLRRILDRPDARTAARVALVRGPSGSGTSALVRVAGRRALEAARRAGANDPLFVALRVPDHRGAQGLAAALVQRLDEGFNPRGFHTTEMLAGFLRRLNRSGRSVIVVLDDVGPSAPELVLFLRAFQQPDSFLPEGDSARISTALLVAARTEATALAPQAERAGVPVEHRLRLEPYGPDLLRRIVRDRAARAMGRPAPEPVIERVLGRVLHEGPSATRALQLLRRELLGPDRRAVPVALPPRPAGLTVESHLLEALDRMLAVEPAELGALRTEERRRARAEGRPPLPATTLWRRLLRLESAGLLRRTVRTGGPGGTRSVLELVRPVRDWPVAPARYDTPLAAFAPTSDAGPPGPGAPPWGPAPAGAGRAT